MKLTRADIMDKLKEIIVSADESFEDKMDNIDEDTILTTDLGFTSVNILYIVIVIEEAFEIRFDDVSITDFYTIGNVIDYIEESCK